MCCIQYHQNCPKADFFAVSSRLKKNIYFNESFRVYPTLHTDWVNALTMQCHWAAHAIWHLCGWKKTKNKFWNRFQNSDACRRHCSDNRQRSLKSWCHWQTVNKPHRLIETQFIWRWKSTQASPPAVYSSSFRASTRRCRRQHALVAAALSHFFLWGGQTSSLESTNKLLWNSFNTHG